MRAFAIVVTYEPEIEQLNNLISSILSQDFNIVIVDNSVKININNMINNERCILIKNGDNLGIAKAQNIGIKYALSHNAEIITFFDQDSKIDRDLLNKLVQPLLKNKLCVTAPIPINNIDKNEYPSQCLNKHGLPVDVYAMNSEKPVTVDLVIASGLTTTSEVINKVGFMDEDFFIDFVDIEWCLRCKKNNIPVYLLPNAILEHLIGSETISLGRFHCIKHSPYRTYYKIRNSFLLLRKKVGFLFSIRQIIPALFQNLVMIFFVDNKREYIKIYFISIIHGIINRKGKFDYQ